MKKVNVTVNGKAVGLARGKLLPSLRAAGFKIPSVCFHQDVEASGGRCRVCVCKVNGRIGTPCNMTVQEGMDITTESAELTADRAAAFSLIPHTGGTDTAPLQDTEELEKITRGSTPLTTQEHTHSFEGLPIDFNQAAGNQKRYVMAHPEKCVHCGLCVQMCSQIQGLGAIGDMRKPEELTHSTAAEGGVSNFKDNALFLSECVSCGQCINVCPYGALEELPEGDAVEALLKDESVVKVVQFAPAVRVALAEEFGCAPGDRIVTKEMVGALRSISKNTYIYDTNFTADLTIVEEGCELLERLRRTLTDTRKFAPENDHLELSLPMITSCSPGWVLFAEKNYDDLLGNLSTCKSPQQMHGAISKHYWAEKNGHDPKKIKTISIMPCVAKKAEKDRPEFSTDGIPDIDHVLTTREYAKLLKKNSINLLESEKEEFDTAFGLATGAGMIFGATGGVMEAALRTAYSIVTGRDVPYQDLAILPVRGMEGVKTKTIPLRDVLPEWSFLEGVDLKVAIAHGIANARKLMDRIRDRKNLGLPAEFHFIEVMCCPGGCLGGGGQPKPTNMDIKTKRGMLIYKEAASYPLHRSHDNPRINEIYKDFIGEIGGPTAHKLLHTHYTARRSTGSQIMESPEAKEIEKEILSKYPRVRARLTNMLCEIVDKHGYVSDAAVAALAHHVKATPVEIDSIISHYHFFPRAKDAESAAWLCECPTCRMNGGEEIKAYLKEQNIPYHNTPWLGWCVNGSPAMMVKHVGDAQVHALLNVKPGDDRLKNFASVNNPAPELNYKVLQSDRTFGHTAPSVLANADIDSATAFCAKVAALKSTMTADEIIGELKAAGLRGCGGAGFPTHIKWDAVKNEPSNEQGKFIVINADEGLPSTFKDYHLMQNPATCLRMMAGLAIAAKTVGASHCVLYLRYEYKNLKQAILDSFEKYKSVDASLDDKFTFEVILGGGPYVCGEETALFESVEGHLPQARVVRTVFPTHHGLFGQPTLVNNVETLSWVTQIIGKGSSAFADIGTSKEQRGVKLLSICGDVAQPVLGEFPIGVSIEQVLRETCGYPIEEVAAVEVGGILEPLIAPRDFKKIISLDNQEDHASAGGSIVVYRRNERYSPRKVYQTKAKFSNTESCQLCVPCREGTSVFRSCVGSLFDGTLLHEVEGTQHRKKLEELAVAMEQCSNCGHGKSAGKLARYLISEADHMHDVGTFC